MILTYAIWYSSGPTFIQQLKLKIAGDLKAVQIIKKRTPVATSTILCSKESIYKF